MDFRAKHVAWSQQLARVRNKRKRKQKIALAVLLSCSETKQKRAYTTKKYWVEPIFEERHKHGFYHAIYPTLCLVESRYRNYFRMNQTQFGTILNLVAPKIWKESVVREPISPKERLSLTLRFLASGDSMTSISYQYLIGLTTVTNIIEETCAAIWTSLQDSVLPSNLLTGDWLRIAEEFENVWNFNNCIGAIDGKHIVIQCPNKAGSAYYNYKNSHSIVLLGICDASYRFTYVDIGAYGRRSDGGIFKDSAVGKSFRDEKMNVPEPHPIAPGGPQLPYVLVGDAAFQLTHYLMRPYPGRENLDEEKRVYNYRLSRARRTIENSFGILVSQWRIFRKPIQCKVEKTMKIVQAVICLHNFLRARDEENQYVPLSLIDHYTDDNEYVPGTWRNIGGDSAFQDITKCGSNYSSQLARDIRDEYCRFFNNEGAVPWQYNHC